MKRQTFHGEPCRVCSGTLRFSRTEKQPTLRCVACYKRAKEEWRERNANAELARSGRRNRRGSAGFRGFSLTQEERASMLAKQHGACATCKTAESALPRALAIDHDHTTGAVRGLLCHRCNMALGLVRDNQELLGALSAYIAAGATAVPGFLCVRNFDTRLLKYRDPSGN